MLKFIWGIVKEETNPREPSTNDGSVDKSTTSNDDKKTRDNKFTN